MLAVLFNVLVQLSHCIGPQRALTMLSQPPDNVLILAGPFYVVRAGGGHGLAHARRPCAS